MKINFNCIGLSGYDTFDQKYKLVNEIVNDPSNSREIRNKNSNMYVEKERNYKKNMGIIVRGELDSKNKFIVKDFVPYVDATKTYKIEEIEVEELIMKDKEKEYQVNFIDSRTNLELSFSLQNIVEYMKNKKQRNSTFIGVQVAGLVTSGKVIFPSVQNTERYLDYEDYIIGSSKYAQDEYELEEQREYILESIIESDLFTVMDTYIIQTEAETVYNILGKIVDKKVVKNSSSNEQIYILGLKVMGMDMEICINKKDLVGIPTVGMRFTGTCWLQGKVIF
ncbi:MAG TPA: hypothetical protein DCP90_05645 [Clostridiales bacterium]|nr:MAG: hypothetical protein A2Y22_05030 [Clostridiales bacterium GWD2_32_59]HAN10084.1 hypothetical protein [Clostridiales bacterium]